MPSAHRRPLGVVSLYERQRERIATPACGLVRDDIYILGFFYSLKPRQFSALVFLQKVIKLRKKFPEWIIIILTHKD